MIERSRNDRVRVGNYIMLRASMARSTHMNIKRTSRDTGDVT